VSGTALDEIRFPKTATMPATTKKSSTGSSSKKPYSKRQNNKPSASKRRGNKAKDEVTRETLDSSFRTTLEQGVGRSGSSRPREPYPEIAFCSCNAGPETKGARQENKCEPGRNGTRRAAQVDGKRRSLTSKGEAVEPFLLHRPRPYVWATRSRHTATVPDQRREGGRRT
jgi:hypothetical protein